MPKKSRGYLSMRRLVSHALCIDSHADCGKACRFRASGLSKGASFHMMFVETPRARRYSSPGFDIPS